MNRRSKSPNDPKLSDGGGRRDCCAGEGGEGAKAEEAAGVTPGAVRCSAWLGDVEFRKIVKELASMKYGDAVRALGSDVVESVTAQGFVVVPWREHARLAMESKQAWLRSLDPNELLAQHSIWPCPREWFEPAPAASDPKP